MINYINSNLFLKNSIKKELIIRAEDNSITITNSDLYSEQFELEETLCSESTLVFGSCESSMIKFTMANTAIPLVGKWLSIEMVLNGDNANPFSIGRYKVQSDKPTSNRSKKEIVAYDVMYDILNANVSEWYNNILPNKDSTVTMKEFRDSFFSYFDVEQEDIILINDTMVIEKTVDPSEISGKTVINSICEINGCFGHIGRNGKFQYVHLKEMKLGVYPSNTLYPRNDLYPADDTNATGINSSQYISMTYEDYNTECINRLVIQKEENDIGVSYPSDISDNDNCYIIRDNFLVYGKSTDDLATIAQNVYSVISKIWYKPTKIECVGNPCFEVGDGIKLRSNTGIILTYILQRTLRGIHALKDTYESNGEQTQPQKLTSTRDAIVQLKGKTNLLSRTIEETRLEISDLENGLSSRITQTAESISTEVSRAKSEEQKLNTLITQSAEQISLKVTNVSNNVANIQSELLVQQEQISARVEKSGIVSAINMTPEEITISADKINLKGLVSATEFTSKFATITTLNATSAELKNIIAQKASITDLNAVNVTVSGKLDASEFTATNISAMNITVQSANVTGGFDAAKITSGTISADRIAADTIVAKLVGMKVDAASIGCGNLTCGSFLIQGFNATWKTATDGDGNTITYLGR